MEMLRSLLFLYSLSFISLHLGHTHDFQQCHKNGDTKVCVDSTGFYFELGNGTWNFSLTEGEGLEENERFIHALQHDKCPISSSVNIFKCENDDCYCNLRFPLPRHPITNRFVLPPDLTCESQLHQSLEHGSLHPIRKFVQQCMTDDPVRFPFLCVSFDNLKELLHLYNNPAELQKQSYYEKIRRKQFGFNWKNVSASLKRSDIDPNSQSQCQNSSLMETTTISNNNNNETVDDTLHLEDISYSLESMKKDGVEEDYITIHSSDSLNISFTITARTECLSRHRKWEMYPACMYRINTTSFSNCTDLKNAVRIASRIVYEHIANMGPRIIMATSWDANVKGGESNKSELSLECLDLPTDFRAVELWAEGEQLATVLSFETTKLVSIDEELSITVTVDQKVITEVEYKGLSKFWMKFYYGDCQYQHCWRDLWSVVQESLLQNVIFEVDDEGNFRWEFLLPILLACGSLLLRVYLIGNEDTKIW